MLKTEYSDFNFPYEGIEVFGTLLKHERQLILGKYIDSEQPYVGGLDETIEKLWSMQIGS
jgi:hypothetical protein